MLLLEIFRSLHEWQLLDIAQRSSEKESRCTSWKRRWGLKEPSRAGNFRETGMWVVWNEATPGHRVRTNGRAGNKYTYT